MTFDTATQTEYYNEPSFNDHVAASNLQSLF